MVIVILNYGSFTKPTLKKYVNKNNEKRTTTILQNISGERYLQMIREITVPLIRNNLPSEDIMVLTVWLTGS